VAAYLLERAGFCTYFMKVSVIQRMNFPLPRGFEQTEQVSMDSLVRLGRLQKAGDYVRIGGDHPFVRAGLQLLFHKSCSKMHGLPRRGLAASI